MANRPLHEELIDAYRWTVEQIQDYDKSIEDPAKFLTGYINLVKNLLPLVEDYTYVKGNKVQAISLDGIKDKKSKKLDPPLSTLYLFINPINFYQHIFGGNVDRSGFITMEDALNDYDFDNILISLKSAILRVGATKERLAKKHKKSKAIIDRHKKEETEFVRTVETLKEKLLPPT